MTNIRLSTALALGACLAFAGGASAAGLGGHGGMGGGHAMGSGGHVGMSGMQGSGRGAGMGGNRMAGNGGYNRGGYSRGGRGFGYGAGLGLAGFGLGYGFGGFGGPGYDDYGYGYGGSYDPYYQGGVQYSYDDEPVQTGRSVAVDGNVCSTPVRSCQLSEPATVGQPCSCVSRSGTANGSVTP